jgi:tetratricopeptide (TPR) repeat protein
LVNWGRALEAADQPGRALELFHEAVRRAPNDANSCLNCADALGRRGAWADAAHLYEAALRLVPENAQAWFTLGNAYAHAGHPDAAVRAYDRCLGLSPTHSPARHNRDVVADDLKAA